MLKIFGSKIFSESRTRPTVPAATFSRESCAQQMVKVYRSMLRKHKQGSAALKEFLELDKLNRLLNVEWKLIPEKVAATVNAFIGNAGKRQKPD